MRTLLILLMLGLVSCAAHTQWTSPTKDEQQFYQDKLECTDRINEMASRATPETQNSSDSSQAGAAAIGRAIGTGLANLFHSNPRENLFEDCMRAHGWHLVKDQ